MSPKLPPPAPVLWSENRYDDAQMLAMYHHGRREAFEEAVKLIEDEDIPTYEHCMVLHEDGRKLRSNCAGAIRALAAHEEFRRTHPGPEAAIDAAMQVRP